MEKVFHGVKNSSGRALRVSRSCAPLPPSLASELRRTGCYARGGWGAPRDRARLRCSPPVTGWRVRRCSRSRCAVRVLSWRGGEAGGCGLPLRSLRSLARHATLVAIDLAFALRLRLGLCTRLFPHLGFPPGTPLSEAPPFECGSSLGGKTHPVRSLALPHWGQPHGGQFCLLGPPPSGSPRLKSTAAHWTPPAPRSLARAGRALRRRPVCFGNDSRFQWRG